MRLATKVSAVVVIAIGLCAPSAHAAATCTWGGTAAAPTGTTTIRPGLTNTPAPEPMWFRATGVLAGDAAACRGTFTFTGVMNAGSTCGLVTFQGVARGLPGVARFAGVSVGGFAPARLYDHAGNVVGSENAQFLTGSDVMACGTPEGMTGNRFSSVIELFGPQQARRRSRPARSPNGAPMNDLPVVNSVSGSGLLSCAGGHATTADT